MNWIKIEGKDTLPQQSQSVIAWDGEVWLECMFDGEDFFISYYDGYGEYFHERISVTHWMNPLPPVD